MKPTKEQLFYFDLEWVPISASYMDMQFDYPDLATAFKNRVRVWNEQAEMQNHKQGDEDYWWEHKIHQLAEFNKIIVCSYGYWNKGEKVIRSIYGEDEKKLLTGVADLFTKVYNAKNYYLSGYAIKRFDIPWLHKRMIINNIKPPGNIQLYGKKPWDVEVFDLPEVWGNGAMGESYTAFEVVSSALGLGSSKTDISGYEVRDVYYNEQNGLERIKTYCEKDVEVTMNLAEELINYL